MVAYAGKETGKIPKFFILLIIGFLIILTGIIAIVVAAALSGNGSANFGTLIFIGPFPIIIGAGSQSTLMVLFVIILAILSIIMFLIMRRGMEKVVC